MSFEVDPTAKLLEHQPNLHFQVDHEEANLEIRDSHTLGLFGDDCVCIPGAAESLISFAVKFLCVLKHEDDVREREDMQNNSILLSPN